MTLLQPALVVGRLPGVRHRGALCAFVVINIAHWVEHLYQAIQIFVFHWPRPQALGALGLVWPALVKSEWLHYGYALVILAGLLFIRSDFSGNARSWWRVAIVVQLWHFFEHGLLLAQAQSGVNLFGREVPTSVFQLVFPRVEVHLFYNVVVTLPIALALVACCRQSVRELEPA